MIEKLKESKTALSLGVGALALGGLWIFGAFASPPPTPEPVAIQMQAPDTPAPTARPTHTNVKKPCPGKQRLEADNPSRDQTRRQTRQPKVKKKKIVPGC